MAYLKANLESVLRIIPPSHTVTVTLGVFKTQKEYLKEIKKIRSVSQYAESLVTQVPLSKQKVEIDVTLLTFSDMNLSGTKTSGEIKKAAQKLGYGLPDAEIALALALNTDNDYWVTLHKPIKDSDGNPRVLYSGRDGGGRWLGAVWGEPGNQWHGVGAFAFPVPASASSLVAKPSLDTLSLETRVKKLEEFERKIRAFLVVD